MNYRHAFHAGNFADCMKHAFLTWLMRAMARKPAPFFVLDTHAGAGTYDLAGEQAARTAEWRGGIGRLLDADEPALADYLGMIRSLGLYPGSPAIIRACMRPGDRLAACERHHQDALLLRRLFTADSRVAVHERDGWEALRALLPPPERRGLILIDPPYEDRQEFGSLAAGLHSAYERFRTGVYAAWYPIKHRTPVRAFQSDMAASGIRDVVSAELLLREPTDPSRLNGCGLLVVNPPWRFEEQAAPILSALLDRLGTGESGAGIALLRIANE